MDNGTNRNQGLKSLATKSIMPMALYGITNPAQRNGEQFVYYVVSQCISVVHGRILLLKNSKFLSLAGKKAKARFHGLKLRRRERLSDLSRRGTKHFMQSGKTSKGWNGSLRLAGKAGL